MTGYFKRLTAAKERVINELVRRKIEDRYLQFGGPGAPLNRIRPPSDAHSEFYANRAMGDWAEQRLAEAIDKTLVDYKAVHYGDSDRMAAGEAGFREFYKGRLQDVRIHGKRPDLLIVPKPYDGPESVSADPTDQLCALVARSFVAVEVRSSKYEALRYMEIRQTLKAAGKKGRDTPSFTVKVEDLTVAYRWMENFQKPQIYCQVFFDSMFAINFLGIFEIIGRGVGFTIEKPEKSQGKATIMIPITVGEQVARISMPTFEVGHKETILARHDAFVRPVGGEVKFDPAAFMRVVAEQTLQTQPV